VVELNECSVVECSRPTRTRGMCASHYAHRWNQQNRERYNATGRRWYRKNGGKKIIRERARAIAKYGMTLAEYDTLLLKQKEVCAICKRAERNRIKAGGVLRSLAVDHDHETGVVRGLLCSSCNRGLGKFGDDPNRLRSAAEYLELSKETQ